MADLTKLPSFGIYRLQPNTKLAEASATGSLSLVFTKAITDEDGNYPTKAMFITVRTTNGSQVEFYIAASGFTDSTHATATTRALVNSGLDPTDDDTTLDTDLPAGSSVIGVISATWVTLMLAAIQGDIANGKNTFVIGDATNTNNTLNVRDAVGLKGLLRRNHSTGKAQYSNDGTTWVNIDTAAPANVTTRSVAQASANNGELFMNSDDSASLAFKDADGNVRKIIDKATGVIPIASLQSNYAADSGSTDAYVGTFSPAPASLAAMAGRPWVIKVNTANTGACTFAPNGFTAKAIKKFDDQDTETGDIEAGMVLVLVYDATDDVWKMMNPPASQISTANTTDLTDGGTTTLHSHVITVIQGTRDMTAGSGAVTYAHGLGVIPKYVHIIGHGSYGNTADPQFYHSDGFSNGTANMCNYYEVYDGGSSTSTRAGQNASNCVYLAINLNGSVNSEVQSAVATFDATNVTLTWTEVSGGSVSGTAYLTMIVYA
jgi:hypothetical protein